MPFMRFWTTFQKWTAVSPKWQSDSTLLCRKCGYRFSFGNSHKEWGTITDGQVGALAKAKKLTTAIVEKAIAGEKTESNTRLIEYAWKLKKKGLTESTINNNVLRLNILRKKGANLDDTTSFETVMATEEWTPATKWHSVQAYASYTKTMNIP